MATPNDSTRSSNVYFNDPESGAEMARLLDQDRLMTKGVGGLFSERSEGAGSHLVPWGDEACRCVEIRRRGANNALISS